MRGVSGTGLGNGLSECGGLMQRIITTLIALSALVVAGPGQADIYKYVDTEGKIHFTDKPLKGSQYRLEWKRETKKIVRESEARTAAVRPPPPAARAAAALPKSLAARRAQFETLINTNAHRYGLPPALVHAVIRAESAYRPDAVSRAGAQGLMQLMPGTAARYGVTDSFDPAQNIRGGTAYLRDLLDMFDWNLDLALAGYNAGEGAVIKHGRQIPPYSETQGYVRKVRQFLWDERAALAGVVMSVR